MPDICNYENSPWRTEFWRGRDYEDRVERIALAQLLPPRGSRVAEIGAGFGRLADFYLGYDQIILIDYARSMLQEAREHILHDSRLAPHASRFTFVAADLYNLPLADNALDTALTIRVLHHVADVPRAFGEIARVVRSNGTYVLEHANKRNLKAIARFVLRRGPNPFTLEPYEFVKLNFDLHPRYVIENLRAVNFSARTKRAVSTFRIPLLKKFVPVAILAALDGALQSPLANLSISPSLFLRAESRKPGSPTLNPRLWRCIACHSTDIAESNDALACRACARVYPIVDGIVDFK
jgi:ubiquinone/menaquinone biosynthesis C-methylase UbiE/uncharacterized protein YbaR (Trm112 family)